MNRNKRKSPREIIESTKDKHLEHAYIKFPGEGLTDMTLLGGNTEKEVKTDISKFMEERAIHFKKVGFWEQVLNTLTGKVRYIGHKDVHTHSFPAGLGATPSYADMNHFLGDIHARTMVIAETDEKTGKVEGYTFLRKKDFKIGLHREFFNSKGELNISKPNYDSMIEKENVLNDPNSALKNISGIFHLQYRFVPAKDYELTWRHSYEPKKSLQERIAVAASIMTLTASIFFILPSFTGFAISNLTQNKSNFIGVILFFIGILSAYFSFRKK